MIPLFRLIGVACLWPVALSPVAAATPEPSRAQLDFFEKKIRPIFAGRCYECHSRQAKVFKGGLELDTRAGWAKGGDSGPVIVPGDPDKSRLIEAVRYSNRDLQMPPKSQLSPAQVRDLEAWVKQGAPDPRTTPAAPELARREIDLEAGRNFWAFQPVARPPLPKVRNPAWVKSPIDAFVLAGLEAKKLQPAPATDRRTLLRRVTFDLTGLPPMPAEVADFLADQSPDAFARVVERLLNSPHYGERWGRRWLDVARYADSNGLDENVAHGNAWRYRDYVVRSFNSDKPFDRFVTEQIAGDLLPSASLEQRHEQLTGLGFLTLGPKLLAESDKVKLEMDLIDEQIDTLGRAFMGLTLGCARCHDHKFDPIPTVDYYGLAAIFKNTHTMDDWKTIAKWHEPEVATPAERAEVEAHQQRIAAQQAAITNLVTVANRTLVTDKGLKEVPKNSETQYPTNTLAELKKLRAALAELEKTAPEMPSTMGVTEATNIVHALPVHIRGSHLTLGSPAPRGVPQVLQIAHRPVTFHAQQSGRLELARWLASPEHPLTARVMVNRIWRWHFGKGLVASTDNFGALGDRPSHGDLLDWLATRFVAEGWSVKAMHRLILLSSTYQLGGPGKNSVTTADPENLLLRFFPVRRLEAEEIRDAILAVAGKLDFTMGGKTVPLKNREFVFNHTSKDATTYESTRRALYLPVIRNHLYDLFEQFDFPDPAVCNGDRHSTVVAPQALLMLNSELVSSAAAAFASRVTAATDDEARRLELAYIIAYARPPSLKEISRARKFLAEFAPSSASASAGAAVPTAWGVLCQALLAANEFIYLN